MKIFTLIKPLILLILIVELADAENKDDGIRYLNGVLRLNIIDAKTKLLVPARIEVLGANGKSYFARDAVPIGGACAEMGENGALGPIVYDGLSLEDALAKFTKTIKDPYSEAEHFYSNGESLLTLPPGLFKIKVFKGPEYELGYIEVNIVAGETVNKSIELSRFVNMPAKGWYSADDHLHIARITNAVDPLVIMQMQAEDIHVGNLLQMGWSATFSGTQQYAHGHKSQYQEGDHLIISGQENLRTHLLGHTITLGASEPIHNPEKYLLYRLAWQHAVDQGALNGYAHFGANKRDLGPDPGLPVLAPHNLMHFMEVLQFNQGRYGTWYDMLNLGFRITPTAGSDYPCSAPNLPGRERFYTKIQGPFTYKNWLEGVRAGRTFVTTGPMLEFSINGQDIGDEISLHKAGEVAVKGRVLYSADHYGVKGLELLENGRVVYRSPRLDDSGEISFEIRHKIKETSWLALRTSGALNIYPSKRKNYTAHSAPIYITLEDSPPISQHLRASSIAKDWLASLHSLEERISKENIKYLQAAKSAGGPIPPHVLSDSRLALMEEIDHAKKFFQGLIQ
ncbi:CehA/McbA family metallohydrolase [Porticoccaceae bacterium]|nr:CehA/McbA family metallohydrolase [Porticoccaceae bacterium]